MGYFFSLKFIILFIFILSVAYTQFRGKVKLKFLRQLINHSTFMSPINSLMYLFSAVPNQPYYNPEEFPALVKLRENWEVIRDEAKKLIELGFIKVSQNNDDMGFNSFFKRGWKRFYVKWYSGFLPSAREYCPKTIEILQNLKGINAAMFALLPSKGRLNPHRDPYAGSLRYHLGLITPNSPNCKIFVDGVPYFWKDGEGVLFDETYIHSAFNDTEKDRIIFFCDFERPLKFRIITLINRFFSKYVMSEAATQNLPTDRVGNLNKIYKFYHHISANFLKIKKANKYIYYILQYSLIGALTYYIFF